MAIVSKGFHAGAANGSFSYGRFLRELLSTGSRLRIGEGRSEICPTRYQQTRFVAMTKRAGSKPRGEKGKGFEPAGRSRREFLHRHEQCVAVAIHQQKDRIVLAGLANCLAKVADVCHRLMIHLLNDVARL